MDIGPISVFIKGIPSTPQSEWLNRGTWIAEYSNSRVPEEVNHLNKSNTWIAENLNKSITLSVMANTWIPDYLNKASAFIAECLNSRAPE